MEITKYFSAGYFIFLFFLAATGIFITLYLLKIYTPLIFSGRKNAYRFRKQGTIAEGIIWGVFLLTTAFFFLKYNIIFSALLFLCLLLLLYWFSRFTLRDYIAGVVFKAETRFSVNDIIEVEGQKGEIKQFHYRNIEIENENGKMILLPYTMLLGIISSPKKISESVLNFSFEITISGEHPFDKAADLIKKQILSLPWAVIKNEPKIQLIKEIETGYIVKITIFSFDETYFQPMRKRVEDYIKENF